MSLGSIVVHRFRGEVTGVPFPGQVRCLLFCARDQILVSKNLRFPKTWDRTVFSRMKSWISPHEVTAQRFFGQFGGYWTGLAVIDVDLRLR